MNKKDMSALKILWYKQLKITNNNTQNSNKTYEALRVL